MSFNQIYYDNLTPWEDENTLYEAFVKYEEREPEHEQELLDWCESKHLSIWDES